MEITLDNNKKTINADISKTIVSLQEKNKIILNNLINKYSPIIVDNFNDYFIGNNVINEISHYSKYPEYSLIYEIMDLLNLDKSFLERDINSLSRTEKIYLNILRNISKLDEIIIFLNPFLGLDNYNKKKIIKLLNYLKEKYIVIISGDVDDLYRYSDYSIVSNDFELKYDKTDKIYIDVKTLIKYKLEIPTLSYITYKAKEEKNVKLFYSKDTRDIIKDIYKHV